MAWNSETAPFVIDTTLQISNVVGNQVYMSDRGTNFYLYNLNSRIWTARANIATGAGRVCGSIWKPSHGAAGRVYVPDLTSIRIYDIATDTWSQSAAAPAGTSTVRAICFEDDDTIWAWLSAAGPFDRVVKYAIGGDSWTDYSNDSALHVGWCALFYGGEVYAGTNDGVRKFTPGSATYTEVDAAAGRKWSAGHDEKFFLYTRAAPIDYGFWEVESGAFTDSRIDALPVTDGYQRYSVLSPDQTAVVAQKDATDIAVYGALAGFGELEIDGYEPYFGGSGLDLRLRLRMNSWRTEIKTGATVAPTAGYTGTAVTVSMVEFHIEVQGTVYEVHSVHPVTSGLDHWVDARDLEEAALLWNREGLRRKAKLTLALPSGDREYTGVITGLRLWQVAGESTVHFILKFQSLWNVSKPLWRGWT